MKPAPTILTGGIVTVVAFVIGISFAAKAPKKNEARVTQIIKEVDLLAANEQPRPAVQNDEVKENTAVRTGDESRSELTFEDLTITRLGANTVFSFNKGGRSGQLESGGILLRVPKNSGGAEFKTQAVTVGITGTTVIFESTRLGNSKLIALEGNARLKLNKYPMQFRNIRAGQMLSVPAGAIKVPEPEEVDLDQVTKTHPLLTDFPPLPSDDLIRQAVAKQTPAPSAGGQPGQGQPVPTITPSFTPFGTGTPRSNTGGTPRPPKQTPTPVVVGTATPPKKTPKPVPTLAPVGTATPKPSPKGTPRMNTPPPLPPNVGQTTGQPAGTGQNVIPKKKKVPRPPTPTPTPIKIN